MLVCCCTAIKSPDGAKAQCYCMTPKLPNSGQLHMYANLLSFCESTGSRRWHCQLQVSSMYMLICHENTRWWAVELLAYSIEIANFQVSSTCMLNSCVSSSEHPYTACCQVLVRILPACCNCHQHQWQCVELICEALLQLMQFNVRTNVSESISWHQVLYAWPL